MVSQNRPKFKRKYISVIALMKEKDYTKCKRKEWRNNNMEAFEIRQPREGDAESIVVFYNKVGGETSYLSFEKDEYPMNVEEQRKDIKGLEGNQTNTMLLALDQGEIIGLATMHSSGKIKVRHEAELGIVIAKAYQGKGVGTELINRLIEWAKGNGVTTRISLDTRADNIKAVQLYLKFGFVFEGCRKNATLLDGVYYDLYVMGMML